MLTGLVPIIKCRDVDKSLSFYKDALNFVEIKQRKSGDQTEWAYLNSGQVFIMLELVSGSQKQGSQQFDLYFYSDNIDNLHAYLSAKQYTVSSLITTSYQLKQCYLFDPDGNKLQIGETLRK